MNSIIDYADPTRHAFAEREKDRPYQTGRCTYCGHWLSEHPSSLAAHRLSKAAS